MLPNGISEIVLCQKNACHKSHYYNLCEHPVSRIKVIWHWQLFDVLVTAAGCFSV